MFLLVITATQEEIRLTSENIQPSSSSLQVPTKSSPVKKVLDLQRAVPSKKYRIYQILHT